MDTTTSPMDINDDEDGDSLSDTDTCYYHDQDIDLSDDEINEINWRYVFQETINNIRDNRLDDGAKPLALGNQCKIRIRQLGDTPFTFPLSNALCSRIICEHGKPLSLSNKYEFCGTKVINSAWQIDRTAIDFPLSFSATIRMSAMEQLHLTSPHISTHFDLQLHQLLIFGPCPQPKLYTFDDQLFVYHATVLVFLPSSHTGGNYRFIDDNDDEDNARRHVFTSNHSKPFILVIPSDCQHEISGIEKGFQLLLVYHLVTKTNSINQLYSLLSNPIDQTMTMEKIFLTQRLRRVLTYWKKNLIRSPSKLLIPLQHPLDYSSYFSILFRDRYRLALELLTTTVQSFPSSFLVYSAVIQRDEPSGITTDSRFLLHSFHLLNTTNEFTLNFPLRHERTFLPYEFLGDLQVYNDTFEQGTHHQELLANGKQVLRNDLKYHVLAIIPYEHQWDLLLDDHSFAYHHLSYMLSQSNHFFDQFSLNFLECILRDRISSNYSFEKLIDYLILLRHRFGLTSKIIELLTLLLENKSFKEQVFLKRHLDHSINQLVESFHSYSMFSDLFRQILCSAMPTKLNEIVQFLLQFTDRTLRALLINNLIRFIFRIRALPRHVLFSTLCSILHLLIVDGSYSIDCLLVLAYHIIKRVRKTSSEHEIIDKYFKIHLIPTLIHIYRQTKTQPISPAFILIYEYCFNTLNSHCSSPLTSSSPLNIISTNEAHLLCPCSSCLKFQEFLLDPNLSTLISTSDHCLIHTLTKFPMLSIEYKHDSCTGREQTLIISKCGYEEQQKQLCFHLRRLLFQFHRI